MSMNWYQRRHGWTCSECGTFNEEGDYNCDSEECEMDRRREVRDYVRRGLIHRFRQERRDEVELNSEAGPTYGIWRVRRSVGGALRYLKVVPPMNGYARELTWRVDWWRVPESVTSKATEHFGATRKR